MSVANFYGDFIREVEGNNVIAAAVVTAASGFEGALAGYELSKRVAPEVTQFLLFNEWWNRAIEVTSGIGGAAVGGALGLGALIGSLRFVDRINARYDEKHRS